MVPPLGWKDWGSLEAHGNEADVSQQGSVDGDPWWVPYAPTLTLRGTVSRAVPFKSTLHCSCKGYFVGR